MAVSTKIKDGLNSVLGPFNLKIDSLTTQRREEDRLAGLHSAGAFDKPIYTLLNGMEDCDIQMMLNAYREYRLDLERLKQPKRNAVGYNPSNPYFASPDSDVLYLLLRHLHPRRVVEIGCGNSTKVARQAIFDGRLGTEIIAIDPSPRTEVASFVDRFLAQRLESCMQGSVFESLDAGDILFVDSSHEVRIGNDVARIFCEIVPNLKSGVVLHFHDIFLPYEYPHTFSCENPSWGEQYLLHAFLQGQQHEIIWPGYWIQRTRPHLAENLPFMAEGRAQSFWLRLR